MSNQHAADAMKAYQAGDYPRALQALEKALAGEGAPVPALHALAGNIHYKTGNRARAAEAFMEAARPGGPEAAKFCELAMNLFFVTGNRAAVIENGPAAMAVAPQSPAVAYAYAKALFQERRFAEIKPVAAHLNLNDDTHVGLFVQIYRALTEYYELVGILKALLEVDPKRQAVRMLLYFTAQDACEFHLQDERDAYLGSLDREAFEKFLTYEPLHGRLFRCEDERINTLPSQQYASLGAIKRDRFERRAFSPPGKPISVGYLSNDFYSHATMVLLGEALHHHEESRFDISLFCYTPEKVARHQDTWPEKLRKAIVPVRNLTDEAIADLIDERGIDILVDLKGHTLSARPRIVNLSRTPVKVSYLGFPGSIPELDYDYIIGDRIVTPDAFKAVYPEKLCRLPDSYQCNNSTWRQKPQPQSRVDHGLPEDAFIFASFNQAIKITKRTIKLWAAVLKQTPGSYLWLMAEGGWRQQNLLSAFNADNIGSDRIIMVGQKPFPEHVSRILLADMALDTFPCNGHTTTSDMLWAGLPVVTSLGTGFASRVSASLLNAVGLKELVAEDDDGFVQLAVELANDPERLASIRSGLNENRHQLPLYDTARFTRNLEKAYEMMAERARAGLPPDHIDVPISN